MASTDFSLYIRNYLKSTGGDSWDTSRWYREEPFSELEGWDLERESNRALRWTYKTLEECEQVESQTQYTPLRKPRNRYKGNAASLPDSYPKGDLGSLIGLETEAN